MTLPFRAISSLLAVAVVLLQCPATQAHESPDWNRVAAICQQHFQSLDGFQSTDLLSRDKVEPLFIRLERETGWQAADRADILSLIPADSEFLVKQLRTSRGVVFMRKVAGFEMIYDRLDRISQESGGQQLIQDLIKLPDGERYAKKKPGRAVPDLVDFLPKRGNSKDRVVKDYEQPTGRIYTVNALVGRLQQSYESAQRKP